MRGGMKPIQRRDAGDAEGLLKNSDNIFQDSPQNSFDTDQILQNNAICEREFSEIPSASPEVPRHKDLDPPHIPPHIPPQPSVTSDPKKPETIALIEIVEKIRKAIANSDRALAVQIFEVLGGKTQEKLRNEVEYALAPSETKNFKLLAKTEFLRGTRVKITEDYPGSETFRGAEATVKQDSGKGYFEVEFDAEIEVMGGKPKKILNVSSNYLTVVPSGKPEKKQHKEFEVADRVTITEHVAPTYKGAIGKITGKRFLGRTHIKYEVQLDKAVRGELSVAVEVPRHDGLTYLMPAPKTELPISF